MLYMLGNHRHCGCRESRLSRQPQCVWLPSICGCRASLPWQPHISIYKNQTEIGLSVDGDSKGVERLYRALSAHMWPGMSLKSGEKITEKVLHSTLVMVMH
ncbi:uncharacterized protein Fot_01362 [Forsythia ovata]|uniref:Uncharacterized protein n=1 Tax=Forsythia ovata TaxID=205694 RepID=A0ABD1X6V6_9LAMI